MYSKPCSCARRGKRIGTSWSGDVFGSLRIAFTEGFA
jgi:hypothetical protein